MLSCFRHLDVVAEHPVVTDFERRYPCSFPFVCLQVSDEPFAAIAKLANIPENEERLVLATGRFIGEGFDDARLDTLFLAMPVSWRGTLVQYAGRPHRMYQAKTEIRVMDYVDMNVPMLVRMFEKRKRGYRAMGYSVGNPEISEAVPVDYVVEYDHTTYATTSA